MRRIQQNLLAVVISIFIAVLLAEVILRFIGYSNPSFYTYDKTLGATLRAGAEGLYQKEGKAYIRINSDGLRDVEHEISKPAGVYRIAILGDSYAEGLQVNLKHLFWKVLENRLQGCSSSYVDRKIEVINFGVSGYGTARELLMLRSKVWKYQPDLVILAFLTGNDVRDNSKALNKIDYIPYFELDDNGELFLDRSFVDSASYKNRSGFIAANLIYPYINRVRILQLVKDTHKAWGDFRKKQQLKKVKEKKTVDGDTRHQDNDVADKNVIISDLKQASQSEYGLDGMVYIPPIDETWQKAWTTTEALIVKMKSEIKAEGADFLIVTLSNGAQVMLDKSRQLDFMKPLSVEHLFYPDFRIRDFAGEHGIETLILAPKLAKIAEDNKIYMHGFDNTVMGDGHWNENGHRFSGELIANHLCQ